MLWNLRAGCVPQGQETAPVGSDAHRRCCPTVERASRVPRHPLIAGKGKTVMKKILFACAVCLLLAGTAHAASLSIGGESISYTVPQGYMLGDKEPYLSVRRFLTGISPKNMQILALYVDEESHKKFVDPNGQRLEKYFIISTLRPLADKNLSVKDFAEVKKGITKAQEQLKTTLKKKINKVLGKAGDGSMSIGEIDTLGVFDTSDTSLSFMAVMDQVSRAGGQREVDKQAVISSYLLAQGKLVIINQYQILDPAQNMAAQLDAAKAHAGEILKELNIDHSVPWTSYLDSFAGKLVLAALIGGLVGGLVGWVVNRKKKKKAEAA